MVSEEESPMLTKKEVTSLLEPQGPQSGTDRIRILVVEDDLTTRLLYDKGLFSQVFDKKMAVSGKEAILAYDEWHPDIIVLDIYLPEMTGYQVLKEIRTTIEDRKTTIVMATALSGSEDVLSCMKLGIDGYIVKPFHLREIGEKILSYYAKKEPERARRADVLRREILKQSQIRWLLDQDQPRPKEVAEGIGEAASDKEPGEEKPPGETPGGPVDPAGLL